MSLVVLIALLSLRNSNAATQPVPECTEALCCHEKRHSYCSGNTHAAPVGGAEPVALSSVARTTAGTGFIKCGTGYKDKADKATIKGTTGAVCCDAKTCADLTCNAGTKMKSSPTQPTTGNDPTQSDCCEDVTGMCSGNKDSATNTNCGTGYKDKADKASIAGDTVAACCDPNQKCKGNPGSDGDVACPGGFTNKGATASYIRFGNGADSTNAQKYGKCCEQPKCIENVAAVTGTCDVMPVAQKSGTCNSAQHYTEKKNIDTLPAGPSDWSNPGNAKDVSAGSNHLDCCIPTSGQCTGNSDAATDVTCGTGYKDKATKANLAGTTEAACCDEKTCADLKCDAGTKMKSSPTQPTTGNDPTQSDCCEDITGMCSGNKDSADDTTCGAGYKDKADKANLSGMSGEVSVCCDVKTCADLACATGTKMKSSSDITQPTSGNDPTQSDCCEDITGECTGNKAGDVTCGTGYKDKTDKNTITGTTVAVCCDTKTCADLTCDAGTRMKSSPTQPTAGKDPAQSDCCEDITGMCSGNKASSNDITCPTHWTDKKDKSQIIGTTKDACCDPILNTCMSYASAGVPFNCPVGRYAKELAPIASVTGKAAKDCVNDAFDVAKVDAVIGYGPVCPLPIEKGSTAFAYRQCAFSFIWGLFFLCRLL